MVNTFMTDCEAIGFCYLPHHLVVCVSEADASDFVMPFLKEFFTRLVPFTPTALLRQGVAEIGKVLLRVNVLVINAHSWWEKRGEGKGTLDNLIKPKCFHSCSIGCSLLSSTIYNICLVLVRAV